MVCAVKVVACLSSPAPCRHPVETSTPPQVVEVRGVEPRSAMLPDAFNDDLHCQT